MGASIDPKEGNEDLKTYFAEILPEYDEDRVYVSDIKKVITWYNLLQELELLEIVDSEEEEEPQEGAQAEAEEKETAEEEGTTGKKETEK